MLVKLYCVLFFFFFQAEDGIRDLTVTGVQTCALPISRGDWFDHVWSEPVAAREAVYTNLAPGPYRFRVVASNPDGVWSSDEAVIGFDVDPLFWQTWWFRLSIVLIIALAVVMFFQLRVLRLTKQMNMRFEERLAERTRDRKSTRLNSSHSQISYAVFCLKKKNTEQHNKHLNDI